MKKRVPEIFIFLILVLLTALVIKPLNSKLENKMGQFKMEIVTRLEEETGRMIRYDTIAPSIFRYLEIRNVKVYSLEEKDIVLFQINKLRISYSLIRFLVSKDPLYSVNNIDISNSQFNLDVRKDREIIELFAALLKQHDNNPGSTATSVPVRITGSNIGLLVHSREFQLVLSELFFNITQNSNATASVDMRGAIHFSLSPDIFDGFTVDSRVRVNGNFDSDLTWSNMSVQILNFTSGVFDLAPQTFQMTFRDEAFSVTKIQDRAPLDVQLLFDLVSQDLVVDFEAQKYLPSSTILLRGALDQYNSWMSSPLTGHGNIAYNARDKSVRYFLDLDADVKQTGFFAETKINTKLDGTTQYIIFDPLAIESPGGKIEFRGNLSIEDLLPEGVLVLRDFDSYIGGNVNAVFNIERQTKSLHIGASTLSIGEIPFYRFDLAINTLLKNRYSLSLTASISEATSGDIVANGDLQFVPTTLLAGDISFKNLSVEKIVNMMGPENTVFEPLRSFTQQCALSSVFTFETDLTRLSVKSPRVELFHLTETQNRIAIPVVYEDGKLVCDNIRGNWSDYEIKGSVGAGFSGENYSIVSSFNLNNTPYDVRILYTRGRGVSIYGKYDLDAKGAFVHDGGFNFTLKSNDLPIPVNDEIFYVSLNTEGSFNDVENWRVVSENTTFTQLPIFASESNRLDVAFSLNRSILYLSRIRFVDGISSLEGNGNISFSSTEMRSGYGWITLDNHETGELYKLSLTVNSMNLDSELEFQGVPIARFGDYLVTGDLSGRASIHGALREPEIEVTLNLENGRLNSFPIEVGLVSHISSDEILLKGVSLSYFSHRIEKGEGRLAFESGQFTFTSRYLTEYFDSTIDLILNIECSHHIVSGYCSSRFSQFPF